MTSGLRYRIKVMVLDGPSYNRVWREMTHVIVYTLDEARAERDRWLSEQFSNPLSGGARIEVEVIA